MGGRGAFSMSRRKTSLVQTHDQLIINGRISLNVDDYRGIAGSEVRDLFAAQDYEIFAIFNDKDEVIDIQSQFKRSEVKPNRTAYRAAIRKDSGASFTDFHNHPVDMDTIQIFSPEDIKAYVDYIPKNKNRLSKNPTVFTVQTQTGSKFTLKYTGNKTSKLTKIDNFVTKYVIGFNNSINKCISNNQITRSMIRWLKENAPKYGFEFSESSFIPYKRVRR